MGPLPHRNNAAARPDAAILLFPIRISHARIAYFGRTA
jgi:hypothetical protein